MRKIGIFLRGENYDYRIYYLEYSCYNILGIGISSRKANEAEGFFIFEKQPKVKDVKRYNNAVSILWFVSAAVLELIGIPFYFYNKILLYLF